MKYSNKPINRAKVCLETIKAFNKACRPLVGHNVIIVKSYDLCQDSLTGQVRPIEDTCKLCVCIAKQMHRHYYEDNSLRKKWHDAMYHYWAFVQYDEEAEELVHNTDLTPLYQRKQCSRGLYCKNLTHARSGRAVKTTN